MSTATPPAIAKTSQQEVRAFWTGPALSFYERLSLNSMLASGARVYVYTYEKKLDVPDGVEVVDARDVLPWPSGGHREENRYSALAIQSDLFRYIVLQRHGGWYVDLDLILLRDRLPAREPYIVYGGDWVGTAVMRFPAGSPAMTEAVQESQRLLPDTDLSVFDADRAVVGPTLIKRLLIKHGLEPEILPTSVAYEINYYEALDFFDPSRCEAIQERLKDRDFTHLWNEVLRFIRVPKTLGPPPGSYLDLLFRRFGVEVSDTARLSARSVADWGREYRLLEAVKRRVRTQTIQDETLDQFARSIEVYGWEPTQAANSESERLSKSNDPQTVRTFWHGETIGLYQLLCLRSFADRGHRVEVFSYGELKNVPEWLRVCDAGAVLPRERVLHPLSEGGPVAIHSNLFRYALLHQFGGWWIDPDVLLMRPNLPSEAVFIPSPDIFGRVPTGALKFPAGHPLLAEAVAMTESRGDSLQAMQTSGSELLTTLVDLHKFAGLKNRVPLGPLSWFDVRDLFDPASAEELNQKCNDFSFFQMHDEVWRRAGVPHNLAPPEGSFLASLLVKHDVDARFRARMSFNEVNRWLAHMYQCVRQGQA